MKIHKILLIITLPLLFTSAAFAEGGSHGGNGGDFIRDLFLKRGDQIIDNLETVENRVNFLKKNHVNSVKLRQMLTIDVLHVTTESLTDNTGSAVDALGTPGQIVLNQAAWHAYILKGISVDKMILHEVLRAAGYNDDSYRISKLAPEIPTNLNASGYSGGYQMLRLEFAEGHTPNMAELEALVGMSARSPEGIGHFECTSFSATNAREIFSGYSEGITLWRKKAVNLNFVGNTPFVFYADPETQTLSGLVDSGKNTDLVFVRTHSGSELVFEFLRPQDQESPSSLSNPSARANVYMICEIVSNKQ